MKPLFLLSLPLPPPYSGEETLGVTLREAFDGMGEKNYRVSYFDISSKLSNTKRGRLHFGNIYAAVRLATGFIFNLLKKRPAGVFIPIAQNRLGFLKYSLFIHSASLFRCKIVSLLGGANFHLFYERETSFFQKWIRKTLNKIDRLILQGEALKGQFKGLVGEERIMVVPIGLNPYPFRQKGGDGNGDREGIEVLFVGSLSKAKGAFDLLEAIPHVVQRVPRIHFHLVGEVLEEERNILHIPNPKSNSRAFFAILNRSDIKPHVTLHGVLEGEAKLKRYAQSDIFVLPSYSESFPFVLLEAAASGLAIVATPVGANPETYREGENALFVEPGNYPLLAQKIAELALNPSMRKKMGENNIRLIDTNHTHLHFGKRMDAVFSETLFFS